MLSRSPSESTRRNRVVRTIAGTLASPRRAARRLPRVGASAIRPSSSHSGPTTVTPGAAPYEPKSKHREHQGTAESRYGRSRTTKRRSAFSRNSEHSASRSASRWGRLRSGSQVLAEKSGLSISVDWNACRFWESTVRPTRWDWNE